MKKRKSIKQILEDVKYGRMTIERATKIINSRKTKTVTKEVVREKIIRDEGPHCRY